MPMYSKPKAGDYPPYFDNYLNQLPQGSILDLLEQQPGELWQLIGGLSEEQAEKAYAPGKWNTKQVLGHLMDTERIMLYRALCISRGEEQVLPGYDDNLYVANGQFTERQLASLAEEYETVRKNSRVFFRNLDARAGQRRGTVNNYAITVAALLHVIVVHERHHLNLLKEKYLPLWQ